MDNRFKPTFDHIRNMATQIEALEAKYKDAQDTIDRLQEAVEVLQAVLAKIPKPIRAIFIR